MACSAAVTVAVLAGATPVMARTPDQERATTIARMLRFVEWTSGGPGRALMVAVVGNASLAAALREACASLHPGGYSVSVVDVTSPQGLAGMNAAVVVLGADSATLAPRLSERGVLTVGDGNCPDEGLVLNLRAEGDRYRFSANPAAAARAGVSLSSRLLRLAEIVN